MTSLAIDLYISSFSDIARMFGCTLGEVQWTISAYIGGFAVGGLFLGPLADSLGAVRVAVWCLIGFSAASLGSIWMTNIYMLLILRTFAGFVGSGVYLGAMGIVKNVYAGKSVKAMSLIDSIQMFAPLLAPSLGQVLNRYLGWQANFAFLAWYGLVLSFCIFVHFRRNAQVVNHAAGLKQQRPKPRKGLILSMYQRLPGRDALVYGLLGVCCSATFFSYLSIASHAYIFRLGVSEEDFTFYFNFGVFGVFLGVLANMYALRCLQPTQVLFYEGLLCFTAAVALVICLACQAPVIVYSIGLAVLLAGNAATRSNSIGLAIAFADQNISFFMGLTSFVALSLGALIGGLLSHYSTYSLECVIGLALMTHFVSLSVQLSKRHFVFSGKCA